jgi:hypothetical protein
LSIGFFTRLSSCGRRCRPSHIGARERIARYAALAPEPRGLLIAGLYG